MENSSKKNLIIRIVTCVLILVSLLVIDIVTKLVVYDYFDGVEGRFEPVIENFFWIRLTFNRGALAGFLSDVIWGRVFLSILSILGSAASIFYLVKNFNKLQPILRVALYLFIPGCTGNLIDRVGIYRTEGVIDFLSFRLFGVWDFPVFNFADMCLTVSIVIFFVWAIFFDKGKKDQEVESLLAEDSETKEEL